MNNEMMTYEPAIEESVNFASETTDNILQIAEEAEKRVDAINKIMSAVLKVTTAKDWVIIGGTPYLQESGATKVARVFGVSWEMERPIVEVDTEGYKTYIYKGKFSMRGQSIEVEGSRRMKDSFFAGSKENRKKPDEIDEHDVRLAAYSNCVNNGIKRLIPGLRNLDINTLKDSGLDTTKMKGYTFKEGSQGGKSSDVSEFKCEQCGKKVNATVASYSQGHYDGKILCMDCQKGNRR